MISVMFFFFPSSINELCKLGNDANEDTFNHPDNSKPVFNDSKWKQGY